MKRTLDKLGILKTTFYRWYDCQLAFDEAGLADRSPYPGWVWTHVAKIVNALSVHGSLEPGRLRSRIVEAYGLALEHHLGLAGRTARDLATWRDSSFVATLPFLRSDGPPLDSASAYSVHFYLGVATND